MERDLPLGLVELERLLMKLSLRQLRCLYVKATLMHQKKNMADLARKHLMTRWYLAGCINGRYNWSKRVLAILTTELDIPFSVLDMFLEPHERININKGEPI